ncbi:glycoside hydrolase family 3 C-terminal domain-containing protein [Streptomyces sp. NBC_01477]|uniref:glycoside hydrolase family 3 C-terminal domain-containing protein n=1 Tax=Streptomyces sp. NBC_01477 TaxID=2976015 RepID=UPI002E38101F|nr:glycoside hydrolase family 3 C-terminal domain-containing protein [Streptomyces sp. NBC_01477]
MTMIAPGSVSAPQSAAAPSISDAEIDALVARLDLPARIRLLSGASTFRTQPEPAVGLRAMGVSDGPAGVRGERWDERDTALVLPSATALAAAWDDDLVTRLGGLLAAEARRKRIHIMLAPTLNLHRTPAAGRHFECYAEDPLLTGRTAAAYIRGVQAGGVAATAKHYVANDSETDRLTLDARVDERTLHEVYLAPFEAAVQAGVWVVMSAYNRVNGVTMSESPLLAEPLKGSWGFDGVVVSDWGATRSTETAALAPQDLAMPGPHPLWGEPLLAAVREGRVPQAAIDAKVRRILRLAARVGALDGVLPPRPAPAPRDPHGLLRRAVSAGCVLLRNEGGLLPLTPAPAPGPSGAATDSAPDGTAGGLPGADIGGTVDAGAGAGPDAGAGTAGAPRRLTRLAVIGPNAASARVQGGGSAGVFPEAVVSPLEGIGEALSGTGTEIVYAEGVNLATRPTPLHPGNSRDPRTGEPGVLVRYLAADGREICAEHRLSGRILEPGDAPELARTAATVEVSALVTPATPGEWRFAVVGLGAVTLHADGEPLIDTHVVAESDDPTYVHVAPSFRTAARKVTPGEPLHLVATRELAPDQGLAVALAADPPRPDEDEAIAEAVACARAADAAVVVVGTTDEIESEGFDRPSLALPGRQDELVAAVTAANPRTVVIVNSGGPVELPWRESAPAVLLCWFPGQEAGHGLADVLFGRAEPGGRLPTTWAAGTRGAPLPATAPDAGVLDYAEGPYLGHRAWRRAGATPAYWFGHGLGYTTWAYDSLTVRPEPAADGTGAAGPSGQGAVALVTVRNTGARAGREVVQVYLTTGPDDHDDGSPRLAGYAAVHAAPGEAAVAEVRIEPRAFQRWSPAAGGWVPRPGPYTLHAGPSAARQPLSGPLDL